MCGAGAQGRGNPGAGLWGEAYLGARKALMRASASGGAEYCMIQAWSSSSVTAARLVAACAPAKAQTGCASAGPGGQSMNMLPAACSSLLQMQALAELAAKQEPASVRAGAC